MSGSQPVSRAIEVTELLARQQELLRLLEAVWLPWTATSPAAFRPPCRAAWDAVVRIEQALVGRASLEVHCVVARIGWVPLAKFVSHPCQFTHQMHGELRCEAIRIGPLDVLSLQPGSGGIGSPERDIGRLLGDVAIGHGLGGYTDDIARGFLAGRGSLEERSLYAYAALRAFEAAGACVRADDARAVQLVAQGAAWLERMTSAKSRLRRRRV